MISDVFLGDCMDYMRTFPDKFFELAIVDPPYGIGEFWMKNKNRSKYGRKSWNDSAPGKEYFDELFRISKNQIIWGANYYCHYLPLRNSWLIWDKCRNAEKTFMSECELAWTSLNIVMQKLVVEWDGARKGEENGKGPNIHPNQRPLMLYKMILKKFAQPGDKIFDSHMGSQSLRIACHKEGFDFYGSEIDPDYFEAGCRRYKWESAQKQLF